MRMADYPATGDVPEERDRLSAVGDASEFSFAVRVFLKTYHWRRIDPIPWTPLRKPLGEATVALVSTAGLILPDQAAFGNKVRGGDSSFREIPGDVDTSRLIDTHRSAMFDHTGIRADPNLALPLERLRELARDGRIGRVSERHLSFMGSITAPGRLVHESAPAAAQRMVESGVDVALLVPV
jgi:D-proline reductase (dithiol) PrdB